MSTSDDDERVVYGTLPADAPVTRLDFERALRSINMSITNVRDDLLHLAAQVVSLTDELTRRLDGVEPLPAAEGTIAPEPGATVEATVERMTRPTLDKIRTADETSANRMLIAPAIDKYQVVGEAPPCMELLHLCKARCCTMVFPLSSQDLDEGIIRWNYAMPYLNRRRASDHFCVHSDPGTHFCTVHEHRPTVCREYTCKTDKRVWKDYEARIPADLPEPPPDDGTGGLTEFDLMDRAQKRMFALTLESSATQVEHADAEPHVGPRPPRVE